MLSVPLHHKTFGSEMIAFICTLKMNYLLTCSSGPKQFEGSQKTLHALVCLHS